MATAIQRRANLRGGAGLRAVYEARHRQQASRTLRLNPKQEAFVFAPARFSFYVGGRGAGKSYAGALRAILTTQWLPGSLGLVGAPTHPMLRDAAQRMFFALCPPALIASHNKSEQHTVLANGSEILWRPAFEYDRYRGLNLAWCWLDEAPWCGYDAWKILKATLRQSGYITRAWATGTPRGRDGYAKDFELARRANHLLVRASTRENAHNLPEGFIEDLGYSGQFAAQELEGLFVAFDGLVYSFDASPWSETGGHLRVWNGGSDFNRVVGGIDWGYTNPTALLVVGLDGDKRAWLCDEWYQRRAPDEQRIGEIVRLTKQHQVAVWYADAADPEAIDKANATLAKEGIACRVVAAVKGPGSVRAGIATVTTQLAKRGDGTRGLYVDPRCVNTIAEFGSYAYATSDTAKRDPGEEPLKQSDHSLDALRYALQSELAGAAKTDAFLEEMRRRVASNQRELQEKSEGGGQEVPFL